LRDSDGDRSTLPSLPTGISSPILAQPLKDAGLRRVTVSMDAVDPDRFARITRSIERIRQCAGGNSCVAAGWTVPVEGQLRPDARVHEDQIIPFGMFAEKKAWSCASSSLCRWRKTESGRGDGRNLDEILHRMSNTGRW